MARTVVTGGAGFIGSHLVEHLIAGGDEVVVLDDLSTGSLDNLRDAAGRAALHVVQGSVLDQETVDTVIRGADRVFHLAAAVGVKLIVDHPLDSLCTNIRGTETVLEAALRARAKALLVSTSEVYGKNTADKLDEEADRIYGSPLKARWSYAAAKAIDESLAYGYWRERGLRITMVRLFNTVGPRQTGRYGMVVPTLVGQALRGDDLTVYGDGEQTRCFSFVTDIVPALLRLIEHPSAYGKVFNLGGETEISINDLARRVVDVLGSSSVIVHVPYGEAYGDGFEDMRRRVPDNSRARDLIGFQPRTGLDEIIRQVAAAIPARTPAPVPN